MWRTALGVCTLLVASAAAEGTPDRPTASASGGDRSRTLFWTPCRPSFSVKNNKRPGGPETPRLLKVEDWRAVQVAMKVLETPPAVNSPGEEDRGGGGCGGGRLILPT